MTIKRNLNSEIRKTLESCASSLSLPDLSRETGVRLELLRRAIARSTRDAKKETWDKIYPVLKPYLVGPEPQQPLPPRIGPAYRRHHDLVEMVSDQKVLLDVFAVLPPEEASQIIADFTAAVPEGVEVKPTAYSSLTASENQLMGAYLAVPETMRSQLLLNWVAKATAELHEQRKQLF